jgi:hypothetical protein
VVSIASAGAAARDRARKRGVRSMVELRGSVRKQLGDDDLSCGCEAVM